MALEAHAELSVKTKPPNIELSCAADSPSLDRLRECTFRIGRPLRRQLQRFVMFHLCLLHHRHRVGSFSIVCPHAQNLDCLLFLQDLIHQPVVQADAT